ncbi:hypothetical protein [Cyanobium sp. NIES-981]|uniref:hypothetical protein n=1 Tax=Cyanobium sp. NIES-981 TaxID=1851505 RepID=UPI0007DDAF5F|nr:hypothetical protein [Cyanobium sp. NIES-981]SBO42230.1 conserved protein of unknown function [Cyanobium sp. NIES-981]
MIPTLSERLRARRMEPYWRAHPPAPWQVALDVPFALQPRPASPSPAAAPVIEHPDQAPPDVHLPVAAPEPAAPQPAVPQPAVSAGAPPTRELLLLLLAAVLCLLDGWRALRRILRASPLATPHRPPPPLRRPGRARHPGAGPVSASVASAAAAGTAPCLPIPTPSPAGSPMG